MRKINYLLLFTAGLLGLALSAHAEASGTFQIIKKEIVPLSQEKGKLKVSKMRLIGEHGIVADADTFCDSDGEESIEEEDSEEESEAEDDSYVNEVEDAFSDGYEQGFAAGFDRGFEMGLQKASEMGIFKRSKHGNRPLIDGNVIESSSGKLPPRINRSKNSSEPCYYEEANAGIAKKLNGKTHILTVFIAENKWDSEDKKQYIPNLEMAESWLKKQAEKYGVNNLEFKNSFAGLDKDIIIDNIHNGTGSSKEHFEIGNKVFEALGYKNMHAYEKKVKEENPDCQNFLVLFCANKKGAGYSQPCYYGADKGKFLDWAILYTKYKDGKYDDFTPQNLAHEILHIFGAWDLYLASDHNREQAKYAKEQFPNDIMRETYRDFDQLDIGPLTAWRVGLTEKKEDWYYFFEPDFYKSR